MELDDNTNERAMPQTSPHDGARTPLEEDVNMDDMNDVTEALPAEDTSTEPRDDADTKLRLELIANLFHGQVVELKNLAPPPECLQYPEHEDYIMKKFLHKSTFTVQVWTNFDASEQVFFEGARAAACGKLRLPHHQYEYLLDRDHHNLTFKHVRFDVCTPFRTLARISLRVVPPSKGGGIRVAGKIVHPGLPTLMRYLERCLEHTHEGLRNSDTFTMGDLEVVASLFCRPRAYNDKEDLWEEPAYGGGEWADVEEPTRFDRRFTSYHFR